MPMFMLSKQYPAKRTWNQLGIVVADSLEGAVVKIGGRIVDVVYPPESKIAYASLRGNYDLEEIKEIVVTLAQFEATDNNPEQT